MLIPTDETIVPQPSELVGRYRVLSELGRGAMGRVYVAEDPNIGRQVALKILSPSAVDIRAQEEFKKRFVTEAKAAGRLNHPNIVTVFDAGTDEKSGQPFIAMELVDGEPLDEILARQGRLPIASAVTIVSQVARALDYAHRQGVVHRDVKPANVLIGAEGQVKMMDFGVAKLATESQTMAGQVLGTPSFMSPEQVRSESLDGRADLFSLGTVLYLCLTGENPFMGDSIAAIGYKIVNADPPSVQAYVPALPDEIAAVVDRALQKAPEDRFQTGAELAEALCPSSPDSTAVLTQVLNGNSGEFAGAALADATVVDAGPALADATAVGAGPPAAAPPAAGSPAASARKWGGAALLAVVLALGAVFLFRGGGQDVPPEAVEGEVTAVPPEAAASENGVSENGVPENGAASEAEEAPAEEAGPPAAEPMPAAAPPAQATLELLYLNRLKRDARITVRVDGKEVWSRQVEGLGTFKRLAGREIQATAKVATGKHSVEVRITDSDKVDARTSINAKFIENATHRLEINLKKRSDEIELTWVK